MYSDSDYDEGDMQLSNQNYTCEEVAPPTLAPESLAPAGVDGATASAFPPALEATAVGEWAEMPEEYLERCAVLADLQPLVGPGVFESRTTAPVEGRFLVVHYPFCQNDSARVLSESFVLQPTVRGHQMKPGEKKQMLAALRSHVLNVHGVAPYVTGVAQESLRDYSPYQAKLKQLSVDPSAKALVLRGSEHLTQLRDLVGRVTANAVRWCGPVQKEKAVAFLATEQHCEEVRRLLLWMETQFPGVLPRYKVFTLSEVAGQSWGVAVERYAVSIQDRCLFHQSVLRSGGGKYHCCHQAVTALYAAVECAARTLEEARDAAETQEVRDVHLLVEEDE